FAATGVFKPGHTKAFTSNHRSGVGFERLPLPMRSGCWLRDRPEPLPDGSTTLLPRNGVRNGPVCARKIALNCHPPITALPIGWMPLANLRPLPNGKSYTTVEIERCRRTA